MNYHRWQQAYLTWDVSNLADSLEFFKIIINSVLSRHGEKFVCFDVKNYLTTPMDRSEYTKIEIIDIPSEFIE